MIRVPEDLVTKYVGVPFKWGGRSIEEGLDCIGIVLEFLYDAGFRKYSDDAKPYDRGWWKSDPQRVVREVLSRGDIVTSIRELQPYDVLLFKDGDVTKHLGVYLGYGKFLHTYTDKSGIGKLQSRWKDNFVAAVRPSRTTGL